MSVVSSAEGSKVVSEATEHGVYFEIAAPALDHLMLTDVVLVHGLGLLPTPDEPNLTTPGPGWQVPELQGLDLGHLGLHVHSLDLLHEMLQPHGLVLQPHGLEMEGDMMDSVSASRVSLMMSSQEMGAKDLEVELVLCYGSLSALCCDPWQVSMLALALSKKLCAHLE